MAVADGTVHLDVSIRLDIVSVLDVALDDDCSHEGNIAGLDVDTGNLIHRLNGNLVADHHDLPINARLNRPLVAVQLDVLAHIVMDVEVLSVFRLKIASRQGLATLSPLCEHLDGERLALHDVLDEVQLLEIYLPVPGFLQLELRAVGLELEVHLGIGTVNSLYRLGDDKGNVIDGIVYVFSYLLLADSRDDPLRPQGIADLVRRNLASPNRRLGHLNRR